MMMASRLGLVSVLLTSAACASAPPAREPAAPVAVPVAIAEPAPKAAKAPSSEPTAETCEGTVPCAELGLALAKKNDPSARVALAKACSGPVRHHDACAVLATMLEADPAADAAEVVSVARFGCEPLLGDDSDKAARGKACVALGDAYRKGKGVLRDMREAERAFKDGCTLGDERACTVVDDLAAVREARTGVPGANMTIESITADGVTVQQIACKTEGGGLGGLFGSLVLAKPFADKKKALDACTKNAHATRVRWTGKGGRMADVHVISGDDPSNKCVEKVLAGSVAAVSGICAATVEIGKTATKSR